MSIENDDLDQSPPTLTCESFDCRVWIAGVEIRPKLIPEWRGGQSGWVYCCSKCHAQYGKQPHPDLPDLTNATRAR